MPKLRHHFVPQFYLRYFASNPSRIHLHNLNHSRSIANVSLRDQCYKHRFYGDTDELEDAIAGLESHFAPTLQKIITSNNLPRSNSTGRLLLLFFISLQWLRTSRSVNQQNSMVETYLKQVLRHGFDTTNVDLDSIRFSKSRPAVTSVRFTPIIVDAISDLQLHLVRASNNQVFLTSDNPVVRYNQYYEYFENSQQFSPAFRGLQLFLPISPKHLIMLYDDTVYKVGSIKSDITDFVSDLDVDTLNLLQVFNAEKNLYYSDWDVSSWLPDLVNRAKNYRNTNTVHTEVQNVMRRANRLLLYTYERIPNMQVNLSFVKIHKRMRRISEDDRLEPAFRNRKEMPEVYYPSKDQMLEYLQGLVRQGGRE